MKVKQRYTIVLEGGNPGTTGPVETMKKHICSILLIFVLSILFVISVSAETEYLLDDGTEATAIDTEREDREIQDDKPGLPGEQYESEEDPDAEPVGDAESAAVEETCSTDTEELLTSEDVPGTITDSHAFAVGASGEEEQLILAKSRSFEILQGQTKQFSFQTEEAGVYRVHVQKEEDVGAISVSMIRSDRITVNHGVIGATEYVSSEKSDLYMPPAFLEKNVELIIETKMLEDAATNVTLCIEKIPAPVIAGASVEFPQNSLFNHMLPISGQALLKVDYRYEQQAPDGQEQAFQEMFYLSWPDPVIDKYGNAYSVEPADGSVPVNGYMNHGPHTFHILLNGTKELCTFTHTVPLTDEEAKRIGTCLQKGQTEYELDPDSAFQILVFDSTIFDSGTYRFTCPVPFTVYDGHIIGQGEKMEGKEQWTFHEQKYTQAHYYIINRRDWTGNSLTVKFEELPAIKEVRFRCPETIVQPVKNNSIYAVDITYVNGDHETITGWKNPDDVLPGSSYRVNGLMAMGMHGEELYLDILNEENYGAGFPDQKSRILDGEYTLKFSSEGNEQTPVTRKTFFTNGVRIVLEGEKFTLKKGETIQLYLLGPLDCGDYSIRIEPTGGAKGALKGAFFSSDFNQDMIFQDENYTKESVAGGIGYRIQNSAGGRQYGIFLSASGDQSFTGRASVVAHGSNIGRKTIKEISLNSVQIGARRSDGSWDIPVKITYTDGTTDTVSSWTIPAEDGNPSKVMRLTGTSPNQDVFTMEFFTPINQPLYFPKTAAELQKVQGKQVTLHIKAPSNSLSPGFFPKAKYGKTADLPKSQKLSVPDYKKPLGSKPFTLAPKVVEGNKKAKFTYATHNARIATVDAKGRVTVKAYGETYITITADKCKGYKTTKIRAKITVTLPTMKLTVLKAAGKGKVTVNWKNIAGISGCQVQYATNKAFKSPRTKTFGSKAARTITGLKQNQYYYFRIRSFKTVSGKKKVSGWSEPVRLKVK